jgi:hypothetical protein
LYGSYATHLLEVGCDICTAPAQLGKEFKTTMNYTYVLDKSPFDQ